MTTAPSPIASLMMYARPELSTAHARLWQSIRAALAERGIDAPEHLSQEAEEFSVWRDPGLVLSQTCGMPYRLWLHDDVSLVGTPDYGVDGCPPGYYRSALVVRADDPRAGVQAFRGARFAYNQTFSQSGFAAPYFHAAGLGFFFRHHLQTGQHVASAHAVAKGEADIAAIDAVTWRNITRFDTFAAGLRVLDWTTPTPGLPLITAKSHGADAVFDAVQAAVASREGLELGIRGLIRIPKADYLAVPNPPDGVVS